ncbi:unnamed protein product [Didymodactylos carnosus]|uniref:Uncharacterized protein n=1 Tax=Didymodactylos carnosus TaxID=1234261 RepID=A0A8S2DWX3_9BILA|nr:unnamed protein product [Didymodactylos carnosus]CAF3821032.1 unnamed protein product [Didymodactylos carnosus]
MSIADGRYSIPLNLASSTVLITGGSSGIGYTFAEQFVKAGSVVIITGRREDQLKEAIKKLNNSKGGSNKILYYRGDVGSTKERQDLFDWTIKNHPQINILFNNAGIMRQIPIDAVNSSWSDMEQEIQINLSAPIHLCKLFLPYFKKQQETSAIINVSSGLAFIPPS